MRRRVLVAVLVLAALAMAGYAFAVERDERRAAEAGGLELPDVQDQLQATSPAGFDEPTDPLRGEGVLLVGRHGAPVVRPEHTAVSYRRAATVGADYLEATVVPTSDGALLVRSDRELSLSTDIALRPEFADRQTTQDVDGESVTGWFSEDFTLAELETLRATEPRPDLRPDVAAFDGELELLTFADVVRLVERLSERGGRDIGLVVEAVDSDYARGIGLPLEREIVRALRSSTLLDTPGRVVVESAEEGSLRRFDRALGDDVVSMAVVAADEPERLEPDALAELPDYVDAVAVETGAFEGQDPFELTAAVHDAGLAMVVWPIGYENELLAPGFRDGDDPAARGDLDAQVNGLVEIGVDAVITDAPGDVARVLDDLDARRPPAGSADPEDTTEP